MTAVFPEKVVIEIYTSLVWLDISADVVGDIVVNTGFQTTDYLTRLAPGGDMRIDLRNETGKYDTDATLYKGQKIRVRVKYGSLFKTKFFGYVDRYTMDIGTWGARQVHVSALDWIGLAAKSPIRALPGMTNTTIDLAVAQLLTNMPVQPEATDFEVGNAIIPSCFDEVDTTSTVFSELNNLVMAEWGYIYLRDGGQTLKVENNYSHLGSDDDYKTTNYYLNDGAASDFLLEDGTNFLLEDGTNFELEGEPTSETFTPDMGATFIDIGMSYGGNLINEISSRSTPLVFGSSLIIIYPFDIASGSQALSIPTNTSSNPYILQGQYKDTTTQNRGQISAYNVVTPVLTTDWKFNSKADGTGTDLSANLTMAFVAGQSGFKAVLINSGALGYLTKFNVRGYAIYRYADVENVFSDTQSQYDYGKYSLQVIRKYGGADDVTSFLWKIVRYNRLPHKSVGPAKFLANNDLLQMAAFLCLDIGDRFKVSIDKPASGGKYYIQGIKFTIHQGNTIDYNYIMGETILATGLGVTESAFDFNPNTLRGALTFPASSYLSNFVRRTICARINLYGVPTAPNTRAMIISWNGIVAEFSAYGFSGATHLSYVHKTSSEDGSWSCAGVSTGQWVDVVVSYDGSNYGNDPKFYIDGALVTTNVGNRPNAAFLDESTGPIILGDMGDFYAYQYLNGKMCNFALYNRILSDAEVSTIHNGGTRLPFDSFPQNGLKFFVGAMDDAVYTTRLNLPLQTNNSIYDLVGGFVLTPTGNVNLIAPG